jgi:ABC-type lipoprotein release transport system permease subunit
MGAIAFAARRDLHRRRSRVIALTLLVGIAGGLVMIAAAGARRTSSSLARFRESGRSADIELAAAPTDGQIRELGEVPGIRAVATLTAFAVVPTRAPDFDNGGVPDDDRFGTIIDRDRVIAGRPVDAAAADEVTIGEGLAQRLQIGVGDRLELESHTPEQTARILQGGGDVGPPAGPRLQMRVVGVVRRPLDLGEESAAGGLIVVSPGFARAYEGRVGVFGKYVRIRVDDHADVADVLADTRRILGPSQFVARSLALEDQGASIAIDILSLALWIGAGVALFAGAVAITIMLSREVFVAVVDHRTLRDLGCTRLQRLAVLGPSTAVIAGAGALIACSLAVLASPLLPIGVARRADPDVGLHADATVLASGALTIVIFVGTVAAIAAFRSTRQVGTREVRLRRASAARTTTAIAALGRGPVVTNGVRMALDAGHDQNAVPIRSAFVGTALGIAGITAALVFASSLGHAAQTPDRYGVTWDFTVLDATANTACGGDDYGVESVQGVESLSEVCLQTVEIAGRPVAAMAFTTRRGTPIDPEVTRGRAPRGADEIALGAKTLAELDKAIGDTVQVHGRTTQREYRIVGRAVFPTFGTAQPLGDGAVFTGAGYAPLFDQNLFNRHFVGRFAPGVDRAAALRTINAIEQLDVPTTAVKPVEIERIEEISWLRNVIVLMLCALAVIAIAHTLATTVRRRRREVAVLKALGFVRGQVRATVAWQAATVAIVSLIVGIPVGILVGEFAWRLVTDELGIVSPAQFAALAFFVLVPAALLAGQVVAYVPARVAARTRVAAALRTE